MIRVENLSKNYGDKKALKSVSFEIPSGQICGYLGPNGAGKSTTVKMLTSVSTPTSGKAEVAGFDVQQQPLEVKKRIGYAPETGAVYPTLSVSEYLALVGAFHHMSEEAIADRTQQLLKQFSIEEAANRRLDALSKGMRQKVVISAAWLHDPEVILLDEPLSGLDANAAAVVKDLLSEMSQQGKTILYCSHLLDVVERVCQRVLILNHGQIVADGQPQELIDSTGGKTLEAAFRTLTGERSES